ncbi:MAG: LLM class flavin-dependent oxidoreductase, partial [Acidimicrobiia bacterium]|nr:LLM class flavin-dependent oxidoreductase [Acidimicrobiia bacterium]
MKLAYSVGYWSAGPPDGALEGVMEADRLGFDSVWTAEAYGSDCFTPLAWWGANTENVRLGTGIAQMSARTPTATAMAAMTLDHLSGGRMILGIGASGPQVVEGWYGQPYPKPLARTREYVRSCGTPTFSCQIFSASSSVKWTVTHRRSGSSPRTSVTKCHAWG